MIDNLTLCRKDADWLLSTVALVTYSRRCIDWDHADAYEELAADALGVTHKDIIINSAEYRPMK